MGLTPFNINDENPDLEIIRGWNVLLIDNDTRSGQICHGTKRILKEKLGLEDRDIKLAVCDDFAKVADFYINRKRRKPKREPILP